MSRGTLDPARSSLISDTRLSRPLARFPKSVLLSLRSLFAVRTRYCSQHRLGSSAFARRYLRNRVFFLFLRVLRCFSSPGYLLPSYLIQMVIRMYCHTWVAPFGNLRVDGYLLLTAAYRSLSRPSSAPSAKASALCSSSLDQ